jgi:hypothetical protein
VCVEIIDVDQNPNQNINGYRNPWVVVGLISLKVYYENAQIANVDGEGDVRHIKVLPDFFRHD